MQLVNETIQAETILKYLAVSGHAWNQLGLYEDCLDMVDSTYFLSFLSYGGQPLPLFIGFCKGRLIKASPISVQQRTLLNW